MIGEMILNILFIIVAIAVVYFLVRTLWIKRREDKRIIDNAEKSLLEDKREYYIKGIPEKYEFKRDLEDPEYFDKLKLKGEEYSKELEKKRIESLKNKEVKEEVKKVKKKAKKKKKARKKRKKK